MSPAVRLLSRVLTLSITLHHSERITSVTEVFIKATLKKKKKSALAVDNYRRDTDYRVHNRFF